MPSTWSQVVLHIVFATKDRQPFIEDSLAPRLYAFIGGIVRDEGGSLWQAGGMPDHVHLLVRAGTDKSIAELVREVKARSSRWMHDEIGRTDFAWQKGYGVFSVSMSQVDAVKRYIQQQRQHHASQDFGTELRELLRRHGVEFDERYVD
ncbi:MAG TPA: IS200/IS605 family transposase [Phycisphaerales bacterium]|nr:IS200/IS605 family transposase [Phycisphaerales bacterium]